MPPGSQVLRPLFFVLIVGPLLLTANLKVTSAQPGRAEAPDHEKPTQRQRSEPPVRQPFVVQMSLDEHELLARGEIPTINYIGGGLLATYFGFGIGQAAQGRWSDTGWIFTAGGVASTAVMLVGVGRCFDRSFHFHSDDLSHGNGVDHAHDRENCSMMLGGLLGMAGFHIWGLLDAWIAPVLHNSEVRRVKRKFGLANAKIELTPVAGGMTGGFSASF